MTRTRTSLLALGTACLAAAACAPVAAAQTDAEAPPPGSPPALPATPAAEPAPAEAPAPATPPAAPPPAPAADRGGVPARSTPTPQGAPAEDAARPQAPVAQVRLIAARLAGRKLTLRIACAADGAVRVRERGGRRALLASAPLRCSGGAAKVRSRLPERSARRARNAGLRLVAVVDAGARARLPFDVRRGRVARLSSLQPGATFTSHCSNDWNGTFSFPFLRADGLLAHPMANKSQVGGSLRTGHQWIYYVGLVGYQTSSGAWVYAWGDWFAIKDGTSGALGPIGSWWRFNATTNRWEQPTGMYGSAMEPRSGAFIGYSPGATVYLKGWVFYGPIENYAGYPGEWGELDWAATRCTE